MTTACYYEAVMMNSVTIHNLRCS